MKKIVSSITIAGLWIFAFLAFTDAASWPLESKQTINLYKPKCIDTFQSSYNFIQIFDKEPYRFMCFKDNFYIQALYNKEDPIELCMTYIRRLTLALAYNLEAKEILMVGLGGGTFARYMNTYAPSIQITTVEIDPKIIEVAKNYFHVQEADNNRIILADGLKFLENSEKQYDVIILDAFLDSGVQLVSRKFYHLSLKHLKPDGVFVQNIAYRGNLEQKSIEYLKSIFNNVDLYDANQNRVAFAYPGKPKSIYELEISAYRAQEKYQFRYNLSNMLEKRKQNETVK